MAEQDNFVGYTKEDVMALLRIGSTTYHKICKLGLLEGSRLFPGFRKPRHTPEQLAAYFHYLNTTGVIEIDSQFRRFQRRRTASR